MDGSVEHGQKGYSEGFAGGSVGIKTKGSPWKTFQRQCEGYFIFEWKCWLGRKIKVKDAICERI
jgi:hypothetical protein